MTGAATAAESTDQELVARFQRGETAAFRDLYSRYANSILAFLASRCPPGLSAEDLAQEVWTKVHTSLTSARNEHFRGWIFRIADHLLVDQLRRRQTRRKHGAAETPFPEDFDPKALANGADPRVELLQDCLKKLGSEFVSTILRNKVHGETPAQIAEADGIKQATVYTRVSRGMELLSDCVRKKLS